MTEPVKYSLIGYDAGIAPSRMGTLVSLADYETLRAQVVTLTTERDDAMSLFHASDKTMRRAVAERDAALARVAEMEAALADASAAHETALAHWKAAAAVVAALTPPPNADLDALVAALRSGEQADMDGTMVRVSRQACEEAAEAITALRTRHVWEVKE